jgi:hypothetical protein
MSLKMYKQLLKEECLYSHYLNFPLLIFGQLKGGFYIPLQIVYKLTKIDFL